MKETERMLARTKEALESLNKLEADGIFAKGIAERSVAAANNKSQEMQSLSQNSAKIRGEVIAKQAELAKAGSLRGRFDLATKPIREAISDAITGKSVREAVYTARLEYTDALTLVTDAVANRRALVEKAGGAPTTEQTKDIESFDKAIKELTVKADEALAIANAKDKTYTSSLRYKWFGPKEISIEKQVAIANTLGKLSVVADVMKNEGFHIERNAQKQLELIDNQAKESGVGRPPTEAARQMLEEASSFLKKIEENLSTATEERISEMIGPDHLTRVDQSEIFIKALFDTEISGSVKGVLFNGQTGLGKSAFLLNAIADAKVKLTGAKVNVLATSWADVLGMMKDYSPLVHHKNGVKAVYYNPSGREIIYADAEGIHKITNGQNDVLAKQILSDADIIYSPTLETPYEFHASRNADLLTQGFREGTKGAMLLIDEFDVIANSMQFSSGGDSRLAADYDPIRTQKYRDVFNSDLAKNFIEKASTVKNGGSIGEDLFVQKGQSVSLADTDLAKGLYKDLVLEAARQAFEKTRAQGDTQTVEEFLQKNAITHDEAGNPRTNSREVIAALEKYHQGNEASSEFKGEFSDRAGVVNAIVEQSSRSTSGYGFDPKGILVYGDGTGRLQNTRPQALYEALALDTVGQMIKIHCAMPFTHDQANAFIDQVTVSLQGESSSWKQTLGTGHYADRLYGFTGTPESIILDAQLSLDMQLVVPGVKKLTSIIQIFGSESTKPVKYSEWFGAKDVDNANIELGTEGVARIVLEMPDYSKEITLQSLRKRQTH